MKLWKALGLAGLAGVAATGAIIARDQRAARAADPGRGARTPAPAGRGERRPTAAVTLPGRVSRQDREQRPRVGALGVDVDVPDSSGSPPDVPGAVLASTTAYPPVTGSALQPQEPVAERSAHLVLAGSQTTSFWAMLSSAHSTVPLNRISAPEGRSETSMDIPLTTNTSSTGRGRARGSGRRWPAARQAARRQGHRQLDGDQRLRPVVSCACPVSLRPGRGTCRMRCACEIALWGCGDPTCMAEPREA